MSPAKLERFAHEARPWPVRLLFEFRLMAVAYRFEVLGPFRVPVLPRDRKGLRHVNMERARDTVFASADQVCRARYDIKHAIGLYVFGLSPPGSSRTRPYYVGQACRQTLYARTFQAGDKPSLYDDVLNWYQRASPFIYLLPLLTPTGRLAQLATNAPRIDLAEFTLIGAALRANPELWNIQHRVGIESFSIDGLPGSGQRRSAASETFRAMLNRDPPRKAVVPRGGPLSSPAVTAEALDLGRSADPAGDEH